MRSTYKCLNCNKENTILDINGSCSNCDNNNPDNFGIVLNEEFNTFSGMHALSLSRSLLKLKLADKFNRDSGPKALTNKPFTY